MNLANRFILWSFRFISRPLIKKQLQLQYKEQCFFNHNERTIEYAFSFQKLKSIYPQKILDVGTGMSAFPSLLRTCGYCVSAADNIKDYWTYNMVNNHYHVINDDITSTKLPKESFDVITCISVLEHIKPFDLAIDNMFSCLKKNGFLIITFPYNERTYCKNVYDFDSSSGYKKFKFETQAFSRAEVDNWIKRNDATVVDQEYWQFYTGDYWSLGSQLPLPLQVTKDDRHHLSCLLIRK